MRTLKSNARTRGIWYRQRAVGKESAYGILRHMQSDEVRHILVELAWQAKHRGPTAFLGREDDWHLDHRSVIAEELARLKQSKFLYQISIAQELATHGRPVLHVSSNKSLQQPQLC